jgi:mannose/fructose/N-acetylgalactosamine-specific phosphotransferase system component IIC
MELIILAGVISFLSLDITIAFQMLVSSPIFACPLIGWILGDVWLGFEIGFLFQLLWLGRIPAGAYIVPEGNIATMIATVIVLMSQDIGFPNSTLVLAFFELIIVSYLGAVLTLFYRKINGKIFNLMIKEIQQVHFLVLVILDIGSMVIFLLSVFVFTFVILKASLQFLPYVIPVVGNLFENQLIVVKPVILGIGLASFYPVLREAFAKKERKKIGG